MSDPFARYAVSAYGQTPLPPWKLRRMAAVHRRVGTLRYKQIRLSMDLAVNHHRLRVLIREVAALREREAAHD
jgi:hypothetical protein